MRERERERERLESETKERPKRLSFGKEPCKRDNLWSVHICAEITTRETLRSVTQDLRERRERERLERDT